MAMILLLIFVSFSILLVFIPTIFGVENTFQLKLMKNDFLRPNKLMVELFWFKNRFKRMLQSDFRVFVLWTLGLFLFIIGFCSWIVQNNVVYVISTGVSIIFCSLALYYRISLIDNDLVDLKAIKIV
jgi:hypothetical protein